MARSCSTWLEINQSFLPPFCTKRQIESELKKKIVFILSLQAALRHIIILYHYKKKIESSISGAQIHTPTSNTLIFPLIRLYMWWNVKQSLFQQVVLIGRQHVPHLIIPLFFDSPKEFHYNPVKLVVLPDHFRDLKMDFCQKKLEYGMLLCFLLLFRKSTSLYSIETICI